MDRPISETLASKLSGTNLSFARDVNQFKAQLDRLDSEIDPRREPARGDKFHRRVEELFEESQTACRTFELENANDPGLIKEVQAGFRYETDPWFQRSWIAHRARTKPSGFAGDFEMLIKLYNEATPARGLGGYLDLCIIDLPLARAVRARLKAARQFLISEVTSRQTDVRILDIACGPCREYRDWPESRSARVEVVAMDNDPKALEFIASDIVDQLPENLTLLPVRYNALRTRSATATVRNFGKFDLIYSVGLCDYLPDEPLVAMLAGWNDSLEDGGVMYVAFKDTEQYDKTPYQWHLDWFFFQRTLDDMLRLYEQAGFQTDSIQTTRDATEIIINFASRKVASREVRTDPGGSGVRPKKRRSSTKMPRR